MKRMISILMTAAFVLGFGTATYAAGLSNGITDFSGRSYDTFEIVPGHSALAAVEGTQDAWVAGYNGATDFSGRAYDTFVIGMPTDTNSGEGMAAGGLRVDSGPGVVSNGVTDFSGRSGDTGEIGL